MQWLCFHFFASFVMNFFKAFSHIIFDRMKINFLLFLSVFLQSCSNSPIQVDLNREKDSLVKTETEFSKMSETKGMSDAFIHFASEDVIKLREGKYPIIGKKELKASFTSSKKNNSSLTWEIVKVDIARSADLGYTFGNWKYSTQTTEGKDTTIYGNYISVWKKQTDGSWKFVVDGGNSTPPPKNIQS